MVAEVEKMMSSLVKQQEVINRCVSCLWCLLWVCLYIWCAVNSCLSEPLCPQCMCVCVCVCALHIMLLNPTNLATHIHICIHTHTHTHTHTHLHTYMHSHTHIQTTGPAPRQSAGTRTHKGRSPGCPASHERAQRCGRDVLLLQRPEPLAGGCG